MLAISDSDDRVSETRIQQIQYAVSRGVGQTGSARSSHWIAAAREPCHAVTVQAHLQLAHVWGMVTTSREPGRVLTWKSLSPDPPHLHHGLPGPSGGNQSQPSPSSEATSMPTRKPSPSAGCTSFTTPRTENNRDRDDAGIYVGQPRLDHPPVLEKILDSDQGFGVDARCDAAVGRGVEVIAGQDQRPAIVVGTAQRPAKTGAV